MGNRLRTTILLAVLTALIIWIGQAVGGRSGMIIALVMAAGMNFFSYWFSDKIVLRLYKAQPVGAVQAPDLYRIVQGLTTSAGLPMPALYVIAEEAPNAFATGRDPEHAVVAVTQGLLRLMDRDEITGVLAHELAHVKNRDILIQSVAATLAGAVMIIADMARWASFFGAGRYGGDEGRSGGGIIGLIAMSIIAPMAAMLIQMAISRSREYGADAAGARMAGSPLGLARALEKLGAFSRQIPMNAKPATAHMFIVNPLSGAGLANLFSTHPPIDERVARLRGMDAGSAGPSLEKFRSRDNGRAFWDNLRR
jgi:heat shock protein HtpX